MEGMLLLQPGYVTSDLSWWAFVHYNVLDGMGADGHATVINHRNRAAKTVNGVSRTEENTAAEADTIHDKLLTPRRIPSSIETEGV